MSVLRLQNNVPEAYINKSRDFQMLCRTYDCLLNSVKFDIDSIKEISDTTLCNSSLLELLQTKLGFFTSKDINDVDLRYVLKAFPWLIKNKGSLYALECALHLFLKMNHINTPVFITVNNIQYEWVEDDVRAAYGIDIDELISRVSADNPETAGVKPTRYGHAYNQIKSWSSKMKKSDSYVIEIGINSAFKDTTVLDEILKYILPSGYKISYLFYSSSSSSSIDLIDVYDNSYLIYVNDNLGSIVRGTDITFLNSLAQNKLLGAVDTTEVISANSASFGYIRPVINHVSTTSTNISNLTINQSIWSSSDLGTVVGTHGFTYNNSSWQYSSSNVTLSEYGISYAGTPSQGDKITVTTSVNNNGTYSTGYKAIELD